MIDERALAVLGTGHALPGAPVSNAQLLTAFLKASPDLRRRAEVMMRQLGFERRHLVRALIDPVEAPLPGCSNPALAAQAVRAALDQAGVALSDVRFLIGHTATPAMPLPSNIALVARALGYAGPVAEFRQACTGFANALLFAQGLPPADGVVVIVGSETGSVFFDPRAMAEDPGQLLNYIQMGDAAAAIVLGPARAGGPHVRRSWQGSSADLPPPGFFMARGGSDAPSHQGVATFTHDFTHVRDAGQALFTQGYAISGKPDFDWLIPHQANGRIDEIVAPLLGIDQAKCFICADETGNTGSAAMWLALSLLRARGLAPGSRVLALGAEATGYFYGGFIYEHGTTD